VIAVIVGGSTIGRTLAGNLVAEGLEVVLVEQDAERAERLADALDALVIHGDGTDPEILEKARAHDAAALVAVTGSDALNVVIAVLGHRIGVEKIVVKLNGLGLHAACAEVGATTIATPSIAAAAQIRDAVCGFDQIDLSILARRGRRFAEMTVAEPPASVLADVRVPKGALVIAVLREDDVVVPHGGTTLVEGDVLLAIGEDQAALDGLRKVVGARDEEKG